MAILKIQKVGNTPLISQQIKLSLDEKETGRESVCVERWGGG